MACRENSPAADTTSAEVYRELPGRWMKAIKLRVTGPGGLYNLGNGFGLLTGIALHFPGSPGSTETGWSYFSGEPAAMAMTVSMLMFFVSGEAYHSAYAQSESQAADSLRRADLLSGHAAMLLGIGLAFLKEPLLAGTAGALHAAGKYGSAGLWHFANWPAISRWTVVFSRIPAILATLNALTLAGTKTPWPSVALLTPASLLICYLLWLIADLLLLYPVMHRQ